MINKLFKKLISTSLAATLLATAGIAAEMKPLTNAYTDEGEIVDLVEDLKFDLESAGFEVVGEYAPYSGAYVIAVTNDELKATAGETTLGVLGAVQRVSLTKNAAGGIEISYTNPTYMSHAYRMAGDLADTTAALDELGDATPFGVETGKTEEQLRDYQYAPGMAKFDTPELLGSFESFEAAVTAVDAGLSASRAGVNEVYRLKLPGKQAMVFGVDLTAEDCGDRHVMSKIDVSETMLHTAHLSYEMIVVDTEVYSLKPSFRIAINFPDLTMQQFAPIMCVMQKVPQYLKAVVGN